MNASRCTLVLTAAVFLLAPHAAPAQDDPEDGFARPGAWKVRADDADAALDDVYFVDMPPGWHITTGPAVILWNPAATASGHYSVEMETFLFDPRSRREAFGLFVGGRDLEGPGQAYVYFLIREGGEFLVKQRGGGRTETVLDWTAHPAIASWADRGMGETAKNVLGLDVDDERVRFLVNGEEVAELPRAELPPLDGAVGMRVNHGLSLHVTRIDVTAR